MDSNVINVSKIMAGVGVSLTSNNTHMLLYNYVANNDFKLSIDACYLHNLSGNVWWDDYYNIFKEVVVLMIDPQNVKLKHLLD